MKYFDADLINIVNEKKLQDYFIILGQRIGTFWALNKPMPALNLKYSLIKRQS